MRVLLYLQMIYQISTITQGNSLLPELPDSISFCINPPYTDILKSSF